MSFRESVSRAGAWDSHQRTSRMSRLGSASGSQPGQYARATLAASGRKSVNAALLMSLHLLPLRCRARSGGFAVGRIRVGVLRATRRYSETTPGPATEVKAGHAIAEPTGEAVRAVNRGDVPTKLVILYVGPTADAVSRGRGRARTRTLQSGFIRRPDAGMGGFRSGLPGTITAQPTTPSICSCTRLVEDVFATSSYHSRLRPRRRVGT